MSSMWCIDNALCPGWLYLLVTLTDCPELIWDGIMARRQEVSPIRTLPQPPDSPCITPPNFILRDTPSTCPAQPPAAACYSVYCGMLLT